MGYPKLYKNITATIIATFFLSGCAVTGEAFKEAGVDVFNTIIEAMDEQTESLRESNKQAIGKLIRDL